MTKAKPNDDLKTAVAEIVERMRVIESFGKAADHIEGLSELDTSRFGISVVMADGSTVDGGDFDTPFAIQSIAKVFSLTMALNAFGEDVWKRVGREPSGDSFGSIVDLERFKGIPRNPFINAGALVVIDMLLGREKAQAKPRTVRDFLVDQIGEASLGRVNEIVADDGEKAGFSNRALANLAKHYKNLEHDVEDVMKFYVEQCAVMLSCRQLALAGRYLMAGSRRGDSVEAEKARLARRVNSMMMTCGQYNGAGDFSYRVGLPAKSGVGGGILAIVPNIASIAVWSPALDEHGNSLLGTIALEQLSDAMGWSVYG